MPKIKSPEDTPPQKPSNTAEEDTDKKLDRIADDMAEQADKTERRYDSDHNIFTK